jgi:hypothetical protein
MSEDEIAKHAFAYTEWRLKTFQKARSEVADTRDAPMAEVSTSARLLPR